MSSPEPPPAPPPARPPAGEPEAATGEPGGAPTEGRAADDGSTWNREGTELARALFAQAKAAARGGRPGSSGKGPSGRGPARAGAVGAGRRRPVGESTWSGPGRDDRDPQALSAAVDRLVGEHGWAEEIAVHGVIARWDQIVGPELAAHVRPERYADDVLVVRADSTAWATQVRLLTPTLVRRLNEEIGDGTVTRVDVHGPSAPSWRKGPRVVPGRGPRDTYG